MLPERILELLAQGISAQQVLTVVGCSPEYLKNLLEEETFKAELARRKLEYVSNADEEVIIGNKYLALEHKILKQIEAQIPQAEFRDTIRALEVVGTRQEKAKARELHATNAAKGLYKGVTNVISLHLPTHAIPEYSLNANKEVVLVDGVAMSPMTSATVKEMFTAMQQGEKLVQAV